MKYQRHIKIFGINLMLWLSFSSANAIAQNYKFPGANDVSRFQVSPDGQTVVYLSDQDTLSVEELYSVAIDGESAPIKLNPNLVDGRDVFAFRISPDGQTVVYTADQDSDNVIELYSVAIDGESAPIKLNPNLNSGTDVYFQFDISPDGSTVLYRADHDTAQVEELYSVPIGGGEAPVKLNSNLVDGGDVSTGHQISPDGSTVVYRADQDTDNVDELYSVPIGGGTPPIKLNPNLNSDKDVSSFFQISPDGSTVVYTAQGTDEVLELYSVPIGGGAAPVKLNPDFIEGNRDVGFIFRISSDSSTVVYTADQDIDRVFELYSVAISGETAPVKLNPDLTFGVIGVAGIFQISPDGSTVVYRADQDTIGLYELYSVAIGGETAPVKLNPNLASNTRIGQNFQISPDGRTVVYPADELYRVPIGGGAAPVQLNPTIVGSFRGVVSFQISPVDSRLVVYRARQDSDFVELYATLNELEPEPEPEPKPDELCVVIPTKNERVAVFCL